jgi:hypothetical protein
VRRVSRDLNHHEIVAALRRAGVAVSDLAGVGGGCPDLLVSHAGRALLVEVKAPGATRKAGVLRATVRARQVAWAEKHPGCVITATTAGEVLAALGLTPTDSNPTLAGGRVGAALEEPPRVFRKNAREGASRTDG